MTGTVGSPTRAATATPVTTDVRDQLRADLLAGAYAPGSRLKFADLGRRYGASMGVLREALTRLEQQRLVVGEPGAGFRVASLTPDDFADLTHARIDIEGVAARRAVERGGVEWEAELVAAHHRLTRTPLLTDGEGPVRVADDWEAAHTAFHRAVVAGCGSARLVGICDGLRDHAELYRRWAGARDRGRDLDAEHRAILDAALARDAEALARALGDHYERTLDVLRGLLPEA